MSEVCRITYLQLKVMEKKLSSYTEAYMAFLDLEKVFEKVERYKIYGKVYIEER